MESNKVSFGRNDVSGRTSPLGSPRNSSSLAIPIAVKGNDKLNKELLSVENELHFMTKLEECLYMCGSLMGM